MSVREARGTHPPRMRAALPEEGVWGWMEGLEDLGQELVTRRSQAMWQIDEK
jgi:hypothetical protein